ncbi:hypothetical protein ACIBP4_01620 [Micromonospora maritima]|uniref:Uncharacterized protein n=1 Tax=Micromonospora maritima TaxID=986711 RepID=A0ABW7ZDU5_9ACTN
MPEDQDRRSSLLAILALTAELVTNLNEMVASSDEPGLAGLGFVMLILVMALVAGN